MEVNGGTTSLRNVTYKGAPLKPKILLPKPLKPPCNLKPPVPPHKSLPPQPPVAQTYYYEDPDKMEVNGGTTSLRNVTYKGAPLKPKILLPKPLKPPCNLKPPVPPHKSLPPQPPVAQTYYYEDPDKMEVNGGTTSLRNVTYKGAPLKPKILLPKPLKHPCNLKPPVPPHKTLPPQPPVAQTYYYEDPDKMEVNGGTTSLRNVTYKGAPLKPKILLPKPLKPPCNLKPPVPPHKSLPPQPPVAQTYYYEDPDKMEVNGGTTSLRNVTYKGAPLKPKILLPKPLKPPCNFKPPVHKSPKNTPKLSLPSQPPVAQPENTYYEDPDKMEINGGTTSLHNVSYKGAGQRKTAGEEIEKLDPKVKICSPMKPQAHSLSTPLKIPLQPPCSTKPPMPPKKIPNVQNAQRLPLPYEWPVTQPDGVYEDPDTLLANGGTTSLRNVAYQGAGERKRAEEIANLYSKVKI